MTLSHEHSVMSGSLWPCRLWPAGILYQGGSPGKNTGAYWPNTLLEHCISCCPSCQPPWVPGAARTPATQAATPPPPLALSGANPSPPGQPQELNPSGQPTCRGGNKTTMKPRGIVAEEEDPKPSHQLCKLQIKSTLSAKQTLCLWKIKIKSVSGK